MFQGFSQETVDFMWGIRFNNDRGWFEAHKESYQRCFYQPMKELGAQLQGEMTRRFPKSELNVKVSRIYRDARRLFGRGPYKDHLWLSIHRPEERPGASPSFWFELAPEAWSCGMGLWDAPPVTMAKLRARMDRDPKPLEKLTRTLDRQDFFTLDGPEYKRPGKAPSPLLQPWYGKRSFVLGHEETHCDLLWSRALADRLVEGFTFLLPYYRYVLSLEGDPDPRQN